MNQTITGKKKVCLRKAISSDVKNVVTIHDLGYELKIMRQSRKSPVHVFFKSFAIRRASGIICVSENTRRDLHKNYPNIPQSKTRVIYSGVGEDFMPISPEAYRLALPEPFVLFVGFRDEYKNFSKTVEAVSLLPKYHLVIAGSGRPIRSHEQQQLDALIPNRYTVFTTLSNEALRELYCRASAFVYPSSYEGFGIPILEAMRCECPVITTTVSSLPEVAGDAALLLDSVSPQTIARAIMKLENPEYRTELIRMGIEQASKFSWQKCADETWAFYEELLADSNAKR